MFIKSLDRDGHGCMEISLSECPLLKDAYLGIMLYISCFKYKSDISIIVIVNIAKSRLDAQIIIYLSTFYNICRHHLKLFL